MKNDKSINAVDYFRSLLRDVDGWAWVFVVILSCILLIDLLANLNIAPLREVGDFGKAVVLLAFTPLLTFLLIAMMRVMPFASMRLSGFFRATACVIFFLILNF